MGVIFSFVNESFPPRSKFNLEDIPDLKGKVIIVTGASAGKFQNCIFAEVIFSCK
jgi:retinol dehydrogenase 12